MRKIILMAVLLVLPLVCFAQDDVNKAKGVFKVSVIIDLSSQSILRADLKEVFKEASDVLFQHTGFVISLTDVIELKGEDSATALAQRYLRTQPYPIPNGIVIFSARKNDTAYTHGGYSILVPGPSHFHNSFVSPLSSDKNVYVAVVHWSHRYASCGYGKGETQISKTSIDGECRNRPGTACVQHNGYSMCADAVNDLYASPTYYIAATIIHEFMHPFGMNGVYDHYGSIKCKDCISLTSRNPSFLLKESQRFAGICPYVFDNFAASYKP